MLPEPLLQISGRDWNIVVRAVVVADANLVARARNERELCSRRNTRTAMEIGFLMVTTFGSAGMVVTTSEWCIGVAVSTSMDLAVSCGVGVALDTGVGRSSAYSGIAGCETRAARGCE